jgi:hypothetical protein
VLKTAVFAFFLVLVLLCASTTSLAGPRGLVTNPSVASASTAGAGLNFPTVQCQGSTATVSFSWQPIAGGTQQWLDLSLADNGFVPGTFIASGPHAPSTSNVTWQGILAGLPHFWRVNTLTPSGWMPSATGTLVPCGGPVLLWGPLTCDLDGTARVHFRWSPGTPVASQQWLDLAKDDASFAPGTFFGSGPLLGDEDDFLIVQLHGGTQFYFRINALTANGWQASQTGGSATACEPAVRPGALVQARVVRVIDGDTIEADIALGPRATIRYIGIDTPETVAPGQPVGCYGPEATNRNRSLVENQTVYLEKDVSETDQFGPAPALRLPRREHDGQRAARGRRLCARLYLPAGREVPVTILGSATARKEPEPGPLGRLSDVTAAVRGATCRWQLSFVLPDGLHPAATARPRLWPYSLPALHCAAAGPAPLRRQR